MVASPLAILILATKGAAGSGVAPRVAAAPSKETPVPSPPPLTAEVASAVRARIKVSFCINCRTVWKGQRARVAVEPLLSLRSGGWEDCISSLPPRRNRPGMEITASSFKLRANAPEGRKAISYQILNLHAEVRRLHAFAVHGLEQTANPVVRAILANPARSFVCHLLATFSVAVGTGLCRNVRVVVRLRIQCWRGFTCAYPAHVGTLRYNVDLRNTQDSESLCHGSNPCEAAIHRMANSFPRHAQPPSERSPSRSIHARQPCEAWRTRVSNTRSRPRKDRHRRSIHARQPCEA